MNKSVERICVRIAEIAEKYEPPIREKNGWLTRLTNGDWLTHCLLSAFAIFTLIALSFLAIGGDYVG